MFFACNTLDVPPMNIVTDKDLFTDQSGVTAYIAELYRTMPIPNRQDYDGRSFDINAYDALPEEISGAGNVNDATFAWWNYECIRAACYFLQEFPAYRNLYSDVFVSAWLGEAYFARAYCYFRMVQNYGGVPIVERVLNYPEESIEELRLPRSKEVEVYDFIISDLNKAIALLPETSEAKNGLAQGRVNKYVALALKARVALTAGSVAKYGGETLAAYSGHLAVQNGLVGIPAAKASAYFDTAWKAAKTVEVSNLYALYETTSNSAEALVKNYRKLYQDATASNKETIFARYYKYGVNPTILSANCLPYQLGGTYPNHVNLTLDFVKLFDDADGNPVDWNLRFGTDATYSNHLYANPADAFADMEPRFKAIVAYPNCSYKGEIIEIRKGILQKNSFVDGAPFTMDNVRMASNLNDKYEDATIIGKSGMGAAETTSTGFYCIKYPDEDMARGDVSASNPKDVTPLVEIRYAEVLLTLAEAAVELGRPADAVPYMNAVRKRAGSKKVFTTVTIDDVRRERRMEFVWECKTYWDLRRWRIFHKMYDNTALQILWPVYIFDKDKYYLRVLNTSESNTKLISFDPKFYYLKVPDSEISKNGNLAQNPGY
jgi:hypothetical protein